MAGPWFLQAVLETREAILLLFRSTKLLAKGGLWGDNELCVT